MVKWVKLKKYTDYTGDSPMAVYKRIGNGVWAEGLQAKKAPDGTWWVNLEAVEEWVENGKAPPVRAAPASSPQVPRVTHKATNGRIGARPRGPSPRRP